MGFTLIASKWCGLVAITTCIAACDPTDRTQEAVLGRNGEWTVKAFGNMAPPSRPFATNVVEFEIVRNGGVYARGPLYEMGPHDRGLKDQYERVDWVAVNVLHLWTMPKEVDPGIFHLRLTNSGNQSIRWLRANTGRELLLAMNLEPSITATCSLRRWGNRPQFSIEGQWSNGEVIRRQEHVLPKYSDVDLAIDHARVSLEVSSSTPR